MIRGLIRKVLFESTQEVYYHGIPGKFPFQKLDIKMQGAGHVSGGIMGGRKYGGFFFTSTKDNAEFYGEYWVAKVLISDIKLAPENHTHPPTTMKRAAELNTPLKLIDVLDGHSHSDIVVVPNSCIDTVQIVGWEFVGDKEFYFESLDEFFFGEQLDTDNEDNYDEDGNFMEPYDLQSTIDSFINMTGGGLDYLLRQSVFKEYYNSKSN